MPAIYINRADGVYYKDLGLQISSCVNNNLDYWYKTEDHFPMIKGKWYSIQVGQEYDYQQSAYIYYIVINGDRNIYSKYMTHSMTHKDLDEI